MRNYYALVSARNFSAAWALFSQREQSSFDYATWLHGYDNTLRVGIPTVSVTSRSGGTASVAFTIDSTDLEGSRQLTKRFSGSWDLVFESGTWKLDRAHVTQIG